jgi:hypothetical protein
VHARGRGVAGLARVDHGDGAPGSCQDQGCGQAGGSATDHQDVELSLSLMADTVHPSTLRTQALLPFLGRRSAMTVMDHAGVGDDGLEATLARVGPRLRQLRAQRA